MWGSLSKNVRTRVKYGFMLHLLEISTLTIKLNDKAGRQEEH
jgi:hypothetical protein